VHRLTQTNGRYEVSKFNEVFITYLQMAAPFSVYGYCINVRMSVHMQLFFLGSFPVLLELLLFFFNKFLFKDTKRTCSKIISALKFTL